MRAALWAAWASGYPFVTRPGHLIRRGENDAATGSATRLLHKDYLRKLEEVHRQVQTELATNRATQRGDFAKTGRMREDNATVERAKQQFEGVYQRSLAVQERLSTERTTIGREDAWLSQFGAGTEFEPVEAVVDGVDHVQLRSEISVLRLERERILKAPSPADRGRIGAWIDENRRDAASHVEELVGCYPHFLNSAAGFGILNDLILTMFSRDEMIDALAGRIDAKAEGTMPVAERAGRLAAIDVELEQLLRIDAALVDRQISEGSVEITHDRESPAWVLLGVAAQAREMQLAS